MRELTVQASSATNSATDITALATEFEGLRDEVSNIVSYTTWNGRTLLDGSVDGTGDDTVSFQIGSNAAQSINVDFGTFAMTADTGNDFGANFQTDLTFTTNALANTAMGYIDTAITAVTTRQATLGAAASRLEHAIDNSNNAVNMGFQKPHYGCKLCQEEYRTCTNTNYSASRYSNACSSRPEVTIGIESTQGITIPDLLIKL